MVSKAELEQWIKDERARTRAYITKHGDDPQFDFEVAYAAGQHAALAQVQLRLNGVALVYGDDIRVSGVILVNGDDIGYRGMVWSDWVI